MCVIVLIWYIGASAMETGLLGVPKYVDTLPLTVRRLDVRARVFMRRGGICDARVFML